MKKTIVILSLILLLTGCGNNKLECTIEQEEGGVKTFGTTTLTFENNKIKSTQIKMDVIIPDEYKSMLELMISSLNSTYERYKEYGAVVSVEQKSDTNIQANISFETSNLTIENLEKLEKESMYFKGNKNEVKKSLEEEGFICK